MMTVLHCTYSGAIGDSIVIKNCMKMSCLLSSYDYSIFAMCIYLPKVKLILMFVVHIDVSDNIPVRHIRFWRARFVEQSVSSVYIFISLCVTSLVCVRAKIVCTCST